MYPEAPIVYNTPDSNDDFRKKIRLLISFAVAAIVLFIAAIILNTHHAAPQQGTVTIVYSPSSIDGLAISLNGKVQTLQLSPATYHVAAGSYSLKLTAAGYKDFTATVPVAASQTVQVNAQLKPTHATAITSPADITLPDDVSDVTILSTQYFYNNTWAVLHVNTSDDSDAILVLQRDQASGDWQTAAGPAIGFDPNVADNLPALIQQYLNDNDYVVTGD